MGGVSVLELVTGNQSTANAVAATQGATLTSTATTSAQSTSSAGPVAPSGYVLLAPLTALAGKSYAYFNHPTYSSSILMQSGGVWRAFSAVCTHAGCSVEPSGQSLYCPCHSAYFSAVDGSVQSGPPPSPLPEFGVLVQGGNLYVSLARIN